MTDPTTPPNPSKTSADHIKDLSTINAHIPQILRAASTAISSLTNSYEPPEDSDSTSDSILSRQRTFQSQTRAFMAGTNEISTLLLSQADALEAATIIPSKPARPGRDLTAAEQSAALGGGGAAGPPGMPPQQAVVKDPESNVTNSGLGNLDIGWLNSRAGRGDVGVGMEKEILGRVKERLEQLVGGKGDLEGDTDGDETMVEG